MTKCPRYFRSAIEGIVEDCPQELRFDVIYLDAVPDPKRPWLLDDAEHAQDLV